jgi:nucleoside-diphosphate-sugar epimerase
MILVIGATGMVGSEICQNYRDETKRLERWFARQVRQTRWHSSGDAVWKYALATSKIPTR